MSELELFGIDLRENRCDKPWSYSEYMLQKVSRTFALNIGVLPLALKKSVLLAYLFCRMADTVEDDPSLPGEEKKELLALFRAIFERDADWALRAKEFVFALPSDWSNSKEKDKFLTAHPEWPLRLLFDMKSETVEHLSLTIRTMSEGMGEFAARQTVPGEWQPLQSEEELDRYCYYVAGTVGEMLTRLFLDHSPLIISRERKILEENSIGFGEALQLVNIIKDAREDSERGISFIPESLCAEMGISTQTLFEEKNRAAACKVFGKLIAKAVGFLDQALDYTLALPRLEPKIRLFCLWPLLMAVSTLERATQGDQLLSGPKVKISRKEVKQILFWSTLQCGSNTLLRRRYNAQRKTILRNLENFR